MRVSPAVLRLAVCLSSLTPLVAAWPSWLPAEDALYVRQDDSEDATTTAAETGASATTEEARSTATGEPEETETDDGDRNTARPTRSGDDAEETGTRTRSDDDEEETTKSIPHDAAIAQVSITEPVTSAMPTVLFKISSTVELAWNYTGLQATPDAIDVLLSCAEVSATWTLTGNWSFEAEPTYTWAINDQDDETPLLTEMYTLIIKDTEAEVSDIPEPGKLGSNQNFKFGLYHPQRYVPWDEFECTGCSGAAGGHDVQAVKLAVTMSFITFLTFTYFVAGWGLH